MDMHSYGMAEEAMHVDRAVAVGIPQLGVPFGRLDA
jgi:hypothetical protein